MTWVEVWQTSNLRRLRLGEEKKEEEEEERTNDRMKILWSALFYRVTITTSASHAPDMNLS